MGLTEPVFEVVIEDPAQALGAKQAEGCVICSVNDPVEANPHDRRRLQFQ